MTEVYAHPPLYIHSCEAFHMANHGVVTVGKDLIEDILALSSEKYIYSIEEARKDYKESRVKPFEKIFDV